MYARARGHTHARVDQSMLFHYVPVDGTVAPQENLLFGIIKRRTYCIYSAKHACWT